MPRLLCLRYHNYWTPPAIFRPAGASLQLLGMPQCQHGHLTVVVSPHTRKQLFTCGRRIPPTSTPPRVRGDTTTGPPTRTSQGLPPHSPVKGRGLQYWLARAKEMQDTGSSLLHKNRTRASSNGSDQSRDRASVRATRPTPHRETSGSEAVKSTYKADLLHTSHGSSMLLPVLWSLTYRGAASTPSRPLPSVDQDTVQFSSAQVSPTRWMSALRRHCTSCRSLWKTRSNSNGSCTDCVQR